MRVPFDRRRTVFIHDYDGVHYRYEDIAEPLDFILSCGAKAVCNLLDEKIDFSTAKEIVKKSFLEHGSQHFLLLDLLKDDYSRKQFTPLFIETYHAICFDELPEVVPTWLNRCDRTVHSFKQLQGYVRHGLLTQSHVDAWAIPKLTAKGLIEFFDPDCLLGFEEFDFELKSKSPRPIKLAMEKMNARPDQVVFIEDSAKNLEMAKKHYPEICTVWITESDEPTPDYVDVRVKSLLEFKQMAVQAHFPKNNPAANL